MEVDSESVPPSTRAEETQNKRFDISRTVEGSLNQAALGKLDVTIPEDGYEAGKVGTVRIIIRNPFDLPVEIIDIQRPRSSHLCDTNEVDGATSGGAPASQRSSGTGQEAGKVGFKEIWQEAVSGMNVAVSGVSFAGIRAEFPTKRRVLNVIAEKGSKTVIDREIGVFEAINIDAKEGAEINIMPQRAARDTSTREKETQVVTPHCEIVAYFQIRTNRWLLFKPTRMDLNTQICYTVNGQQRTQVVSCCLDMKPPLTSIVIGALSGAVLGSLARCLQISQCTVGRFFVVAGTSMVLSLIATVALARKSGAQGFITVEDFFGGFVIGTLIGYQGPDYFDKSVIGYIDPSQATSLPGTPGAK